MVTWIENFENPLRVPRETESSGVARVVVALLPTAAILCQGVDGSFIWGLLEKQANGSLNSKYAKHASSNLPPKES